MMIQISALLDSQGAIKAAETAQKNGFHGVSVPEHVGTSENVLVTLGAISQRCEKLHIMTNLVNHNSRHPLIIGMAASTLSQLTSGKFILGLGTGAAEGLKIMNVQDQQPLAKLRESILIIRRLLAGGEVNYEGRYFSASSAKLTHGKRFPVPIYVAAIQEKAVRFVSRLADGILFSTCSTVPYVRHNSRIVKADAGGRDFQIACLISYLPVKDRAEALKSARTIVQRYLLTPGIGEALLGKSGFDPAIAAEVRRGDLGRLSEEILESMVVVGGRDRVVDRLQEMKKEGVTLPILSTLPPYLDEVLRLPKDSNLGE